jgi:hypothetical protein
MLPSASQKTVLTSYRLWAPYLAYFLWVTFMWWLPMLCHFVSGPKRLYHSLCSMFTLYDTRNQEFCYFLAAYNVNMEQRLHHKLLTQLLTTCKAVHSLSMVCCQCWEGSEHSDITWYTNLYHSTSDSVYVSSLCKSFPMQWVLQFNSPIIVTWTVVGRTLKVIKHFPPPTPDPCNHVCLANSFTGQCQSSFMHCSVTPTDKKHPLWCMLTTDTLPLLNASTYLANFQHYTAE